MYADALPDLITGNVTLMQNLTETGRLVELGQFLDADPEWRATFFDNAFDEYIQPNGDLFAISYSLDYVSIYWNTALFEDAGIEEFPTTWDDFMAARHIHCDARARHIRFGSWCDQRVDDHYFHNASLLVE